MGKVLLNMRVNMYSNNVQQGREQWKKPRSLCVIAGIVCVCVASLQHESR